MDLPIVFDDVSTIPEHLLRELSNRILCTSGQAVPSPTAPETAEK
ncbi:hypothetical protein ACFC1B_07180 [Streptomyces xiamenensis]